MKNCGDNNSSTSDGYADDDTGVEANSYFHQIFIDQLIIDAIIQMIARLKESAQKRLVV